MAHVGQEVRFLLRCGSGRVMGIGHRCLRLCLRRHIGNRPDEAGHAAGIIGERSDGDDGHTGWSAFTRNFEPIGELRPVIVRIVESAHEVGTELGGDDTVEGPSDGVGRLDAGDLRPSGIGVDVAPLCIGLEDPYRGDIGDHSQVVGGDLQVQGPCGQEVRIHEEIGKDQDLGTELARINGGEDEIDGSLGKAVHIGDLVALGRGDEDDRCHFGLLTLTDQGCGLESIHDGHEDIEEDGGEILLHQTAQRRHPGIRLDDREVQRVQCRSEGSTLEAVVVNDEDMDRSHSSGNAAVDPSMSASSAMAITRLPTISATTGRWRR